MTDVTDDFPGTTLDPAWTQLTGTAVVAGGAVNPNGLIVRTGETFSADPQTSQITIVEATETGFCPIVRVTDANNFYYFFISGTTAQIFRMVAGVFAAVSSQAVGLSVAAGAVWKLEIVGTLLRGYLNAVQVCSGTDSSFSTGNPGIIDFQQSTATIDQWVGGPLAEDDDLPEPASRRKQSMHGGTTGGMQVKRRPSGLYVPQQRLIVPGWHQPAHGELRV